MQWQQNKKKTFNQESYKYIICVQIELDLSSLYSYIAQKIDSCNVSES